MDNDYLDLSSTDDDSDGSDDGKAQLGVPRRRCKRDRTNRLCMEEEELDEGVVEPLL